MQAQWTRTPFRLAAPVAGSHSPRYYHSPVAGHHSSSLSSLGPFPRLFSRARSGSQPCRSAPSPSPSPTPARPYSSSSSSASSRWKQRQGSDRFAREARVRGLKSRAAFKLLELDSKYHLFRRGQGQVVVDLGFAPGSWSQVALDRTAPDGRVVGIDVIPAQPPRGVSTIQGNFLSPGVRALVKQFLLEGERRRRAEAAAAATAEGEAAAAAGGSGGRSDSEGDIITDRPSYIDLERMDARENGAEASPTSSPGQNETQSKPNLRLVDVRIQHHELLSP